MDEPDTFRLLREWWEIEPEYAVPIVVGPGFTEQAKGLFFDVLEAINRRDWRWNLDSDDMHVATICGEGGCFAEPVKAYTSDAPVPQALLTVTLEAYLKCVRRKSLGM